MNLTPPADRVLIRQCEPEAETTFGLAIPENAREQSQRGIVVAVGAGAHDRNGAQHPLGEYEVALPDIQDGKYVEVPSPRQLKIGDEVVLPRYGGTEIDWNNETLVSILASEILGVLV